MNPWLKIMRPLNGLMSAFTVIIVGVSINGINIIMPNVLIGFIVAFLTNAGGNILNDYLDREVDKINHPERPIPSGRISPKSALYFGISIFILSLILSFFINLYAFIINIAGILLLIFYEIKFKNLGFSGNFLISFILLLLFLFSGSIFLKFDLPFILGLMAFFSTLGREITKDVEDMAGDFNRITIPKRIGVSRSLLLSGIFYIIAIILSPSPYLLGYFGIAYIIAVSIADIIFIYSVVIQFNDPGKGERFAKIAMVLALVSYLVGGVIK